MPRQAASIFSATTLYKDSIRMQPSSLVEQLMIPPVDLGEKVKTPELELELDR